MRLPISHPIVDRLQLPSLIYDEPRLLRIGEVFTTVLEDGLVQLIEFKEAYLLSTCGTISFENCTTVLRHTASHVLVSHMNPTEHTARLPTWK